MTIQTNSFLNVSDNSGAKEIKCIRSSNKVYLGSPILGSIQKVIPNKKLKTGEIVPGIIVRLKKEQKRKDGTYINFSTNDVVLLNNKKLPIGSRIFGPVSRELRNKKYMKAIAIAQGII